MKVFIADDSLLLQERLAGMISEIDNVVISGTAENAVEAYLAIKKLKPDVVITDIRMPGGGGIDLLKNLKEISPGIIVIVFTNYPFIQYKRKCEDEGADYFFYKREQLDNLLETVKKLASSNLKFSENHVG